MRWEHGRRRRQHRGPGPGCRVSGTPAWSARASARIGAALVVDVFRAWIPPCAGTGGQSRRPPRSEQQPAFSPEEEKLKEFMSVVLAEPRTSGAPCSRPQARLPAAEAGAFSRPVQSRCGFAEAAMGPFYCPGR